MSPVWYMGGDIHSMYHLYLSVHQVAWAPGRGCKGSSFKTYWVLKQGVTVIPWSLIKGQEDLDALGDGGEVDLDTSPPGLQLPPQALGGGEEVVDLHEVRSESQGSQTNARTLFPHVGPLPDQSQPPFLPPVGENNLLQ